jgi:RNA polymerase sigma-70 factor (family 1)
MKAADQEDKQLIASIGLGDEAALQLLLRKYSPHLCQFAASILHRHDLAEEAVANVFITLWQRRETLQIKTNVRGYLFTAACHHSLKLLRSQVHTSDVSLDEISPRELMQKTAADSELQYREFTDTVEAMLKTLPTECQQVFRMNRFENLRYKDIASALGISVDVVQKHMTHARRKIAAALPDWADFINKGWLSR